MTTTQITKTYVIRDENGRYLGDGHNRRDVEASAKRAAQTFGRCVVITVGDEIVTLVERLDGRSIVTRLA